MKSFILFFGLIILSDGTFAKSKKIFTPSVDFRFTTDDNTDVPSFVIKGVDSSGNQFSSVQDASQKACVLYEVLKETVIDDVEEYSEGKVGFQFLNCPYSETETKFTISSQKEQKISVSSKIDYKAKTPLADAYDELDMLKNQSADYTVKINTTDPSKSTIEKVVTEGTLENDINLCLEQSYFVKKCVLTNKLNLPDECIIGSEPTPAPSPKPPVPNPADKTVSARLKTFIDKAKTANSQNTQKKSLSPGIAERCTMNNVCYMGAVKEQLGDFKSQTLSKKKTSLLKLDYIINSAAEKKEIKNPCVNIIKKDIGILFKKY